MASPQPQRSWFEPAAMLACSCFRKSSWKQSIIHAWFSSQLGPVGPHLAHCGQAPLRNCLRHRFVEEAPSWRVNKTLSPFSRRVTAIDWHPRYHNAVAFGSHGGDIQLWSFEDPARNYVIRGLGYGYGCITSMKFHPENPRLIYTTSVDGRFCLQDFEGRRSSVFLDTQNLAFWWCSADVSQVYDVIFVGGNTGKAVLLDLAGQVVREYPKLHRGKIKHVQFCPGKEWLFATGSVDHTAALWDIRMLRDGVEGTKPLSVLDHDAPVNSALFDPHFGTRLLTTAQNSELRLYDACDNWESATTTHHPHRHYQHMTDIVAAWHPVHSGLCVVGRYPGREDTDQTRSVDLIDVETGERVAYLFSPTLKGVVVLNRFNQFGTCLASGMGYHCLLWQMSGEVVQRARERVREESSGGGLVSSGAPVLLGSVSQRKRRGKRKREDSIEEGQVKKNLRKPTISKSRKKL